MSTEFMAMHRPTYSVFLRLFFGWVGLFLGAARFATAAPSANPPPPTPEAYRLFALQHDGDVNRGRQLFADESRLGCTKCHSIDGRATRAGPDLAAVGDQFSRPELIEAILTPSATIAVGFGTTVIETTSGEPLTGVLKASTPDGVEIMGADGQRVRVPKSEIRALEGSPGSLMPEGLALGLTTQEFADLVEFLVSRRESSVGAGARPGMLEEIPALERPVAFVPLLPANLEVPPAVGGPTLGLVWFGVVPGRPWQFWAAHQSGRLWWIEKSSSGTAVGEFADFSREIFSARGPNGLLGLAFHPRFRENRKYYLKQQVLEAGRITTLLLERTATADGRSDSGDPARRLLQIEAVAEHHNGGCIEFGPDGYLYFGMGDSAPNFDPQGHGQDPRLLFGKLLRLDVDHATADRPYAIPPDNPFVGQANYRPEIWALGLREPWRFSFDSATGDLWLADLGQERGDEIDLVRRGENFGWNVYEGFELFSKTHRREGERYVPPLFSTWRRQGTCIVGGRVYRGTGPAEFRGLYIFGDHQSKRVWGLTHENRELKSIWQLGTLPQSVTSFAADPDGELYVTGYQGMVYRLDFSRAALGASATNRLVPAVLPDAPGRSGNRSAVSSEAQATREVTSVIEADARRFERGLSSPAAWRRIESIQGLAHLKHWPAERAVQRALGDSVPEVRHEALLALCRLGTASSVPLLIRQLEDANWEGREQARLGLERLTALHLGSEATAANWTDAWRAATQSNYVGSLLRRVEELPSASGADTTAGVASSTSAGARETEVAPGRKRPLRPASVRPATLPARREALRALRHLATTEHEPALLAWLQNGQRPPLDADERALICEALERIGSDRAVPVLAAERSEAAAWALGRLGGPAAEAALLNFPGSLATLLALDRVGSKRCGPFIPALVGQMALITFRSHPDDVMNPEPQPIQRVAANLIRRSGQADLLTELVLQELEGSVRPPVASGPRPTCPPEWEPMLRAMRSELKPGFVREDGVTTSQPIAAVCYLADDPALVPRLIPLLRHPAYVARVYVALTLGRLRATNALPALLELVREGYAFSDSTALASGKHFDQSQTVRWRGFLCFAVGRLGSEEARRALETLVSDLTQPRDIRYGAAVGLGFIGSEFSLATLDRVAEQDPIWMVRDEAQRVARTVRALEPEMHP